MSRQMFKNIVTPDGKFRWSFECPDPERMTRKDRESIVAHIVVVLRLDNDCDDKQETPHDDQLTPEAVEKAMSRKPIEGHTPGPRTLSIETMDAIIGDDYRLAYIPEIERSLHDSEWAEPQDWERDMANGSLMASAPDLQTENQTLQALCRQQHEALSKVMKLPYHACKADVDIVLALWPDDPTEDTP